MSRLGDAHIPDNSTTAKIIKALGGATVVYNLPLLEMRADFHKGTYPADGVNSKDMTKPVMKIYVSEYQKVPAFALRTRHQKDGGGRMLITNKDENLAVSIGSDKNGGRIQVYNKSVKDIVHLFADKHGDGFVETYNRKGKGNTLKP